MKSLSKNVCPFIPCAKVMYTKILEPVKIIECAFFRMKVLYPVSNRNSRNFDPNARGLTKLEPNEIFNDFAISRQPFDEIDFFNFMGNPNLNSVLFTALIRSKPMLKLNEIFKQALLKAKKEKIGIHSGARPTISSLLVYNQ